MLAALPLAALAAGCQRQSEPDLPPEVQASASGVPASTAAADQLPPDVSASPDAEANRPQPTAMNERVATLGLLNKRNNITTEIKLKPGQSQRLDNVIVKLDACERTAPWEENPETGAFVQLFVEERATVRERLAWHKVFSGWLFKSSPSLNAVEHPVYDVWVKDCAMNFPGEEDSPAAAASSSKAAKPKGKSPAPGRAPAPRASPLPPPVPAPA
jgi:hypothetical protein